MTLSRLQIPHSKKEKFNINRKQKMFKRKLVHGPITLEFRNLNIDREQSNKKMLVEILQSRVALLTE